MSKFLTVGIFTVGVFVSCAAVPGWADIWTGTISYTVTSVECVPLAGFPCPSVGDTFTGKYQYISPTINFTWVCGFNPPCSVFDPPISGEVFFPDGFTPILADDVHLNPVDFTDGAAEIGHFSIVGGHFTDFEWDGQLTANSFAFGLNGFSMTKVVTLQQIDHIEGPVSVGDPQPAPDPPTVMLLGIGLGALLACGKRKSWSGSA
jgi:hypothetical protein